MTFTGQQLDKHFIAATNTHATIEERFISMWSVLRSYNQDSWIVQLFEEAGSNTSTVALRVVGSDEKGSLRSETVKYGRESQGTLTRE
jgi:hypothetical protein